MTNAPSTDVPASKLDGVTRVAYVVIAMIALCCAADVARYGLVEVTKLEPHPYFQSHGLAIFGLPVVALFTFSLVCIMRAVDPAFRIDLIGVKADGTAAALMCWVLVFSVAIFALRALW